MRVPDWIGHRFISRNEYIGSHLHIQIKSLLRELSLHTVCEEAKCPNIGECFGKGTATFLILGNICTRNCGFCGVKKGTPNPVDDSEVEHIVQAIDRLGLYHVVITSVTRDDLSDGGVAQFVATVKEIRNCARLKPYPTIELLLPILDFDGVKQIVGIHPEVINHNVETVPRLYQEVRPNFKYLESIKLLGLTKSLNCSIITKSGIMVGLGEIKDEVVQVMKDLREQQVDIFTIGQYLRPSGRQVPVIEYVHPMQFMEYKEIGYKIGFRYVAAGPYVRSSYNACKALVSASSSLSKITPKS